jgi:creatinine amidohydrolase/Fe(II)-dependent formamide hydrolase-like protein
MHPQKVKWEEMLPDEFLEALESCPVCYMAYGLAEPHGAYSALGLDWLKAYSICEEAATTHGGILAPPLCWHVQERPEFDWPRMKGTAQSLSSSIPGDLFLRLVLHHLRVFDARGFHAAILITGHYGGLEKDMRLVAEYYKKRSGSPMQIRCLADWECIDFGNYRGDHAGMCETQQLMAIRPDLVDLSQKEPSPKSGPWCGKDFAEAGLTPDAETGKKIVASQVRKLGEIQSDLLAAYGGCDAREVPDQNEVDEYWRTFERLTRKYWAVSVTWDEYKAGPPTFPGWDALGQ